MGWLNNFFFQLGITLLLCHLKITYSCIENTFIFSARSCNDLLSKQKKQVITQYTTFYHFANCIGLNGNLYRVLGSIFFYQNRSGMEKNVNYHTCRLKSCMEMSIHIGAKTHV